MSRYLLRMAFLGSVYQTLILGAFLFLPAWTFNWWRAWVFIAVTMIATTSTVLIVFPGREGLLRERARPLMQEGQPFIDKIIVNSFLISFMAVVVLIPLDIFHWHLLPQPKIFVSASGLLLYITGWVIISLCFKDNAFTAPVVKHQKERQHFVVDTGVYSIVRHPMYAGFILYAAGTTLWLESYTATIASIIPIALLVIRIINEEQFLKEELRGYEEYTKRVRYRLIPYIW